MLSFWSYSELWRRSPQLKARNRPHRHPLRSSTRASATAVKTPWGDPDLQGIWLNATITPLERPAGLADKPFLTEAEAAAFEKRTLQQREESERAPRPGEVGAYNNAWFDQGTKVVSTRQTSLVVDPPDGRVPVKPEAEKIRDDNLARNGDSYEYMSVWDRCISRGMPGAMFPAGYNNAYQILQSPGYVVIVHEMIHEVRIIPLDRRPHLPSDIKLWMGDSRGHWEGTTLVVETTNFGKKGWIATSGASGRIKGIPQSETLRVVERFTPAGADAIQYEVTVEDPAMYFRPWKVAMPLGRDQEYQMFEYACHEGNHAMANILNGARTQTPAADTTVEPEVMRSPASGLRLRARLEGVALRRTAEALAEVASRTDHRPPDERRTIGNRTRHWRVCRRRRRDGDSYHVRSRASPASASPRSPIRSGWCRRSE